ncbi:MAG: ABC transporter ATP-binding protein [Ezakiella sp.]|nr:ABC transporter ATP-binding protein [Bacillota bacterium]MDY3923483.1 ABC transporter ATP-binding protein [Ezakiella sp.]
MEIKRIKVQTVSYLLLVGTVIFNLFKYAGVVSFVNIAIKYLNKNSLNKFDILLVVLYFLGVIFSPLFDSLYEMYINRVRMEIHEYNFMSKFLQSAALSFENVNDKSLKKAKNYFMYSWMGYQRLMENIKIILGGLLSIIYIFFISDKYVRIVILSAMALFVIMNIITSKVENDVESRVKNSGKILDYYFSLITDRSSVTDIKSNGYSNVIREFMIDHYNKSKTIVKNFKYKIALSNIGSIIPSLLGFIWLFFLVKKGIITYQNAIVTLVGLRVINSFILSFIKNAPYLRSDLNLRKTYFKVDKYMSNRLEQEISKQKLNYINEIEFRDVSFKYKNSDVYSLKNFSYSFKSGKSYALVGKSGAGKTTIINLILGFLEPTEGKILVNNIDLRNIDKFSYYNLISSVFQDSEFLPFKISENLSFTNKEFNYDKEADRFFRNNTPNISQYFSDTFYKEGRNFSGGEKNALNILRSLSKCSQCTILDEATAAMDIINEIETIKTFVNLMKDKLAIIVTHRLPISKFCDEILVIDDGLLIESGNYKDLLELDGRYKLLNDIQNEGYEYE